MKTAALLLVALSGAVGVEPNRAAVGQPIAVTGPPGRLVTLQSLEAGGTSVLGQTDRQGRLATRVPEVPAGNYRVVVADESEAPVLEVTALSRGTSIALLLFGALFVLGVFVAGVVVHRRWREAIS